MFSSQLCEFGVEKHSNSHQWLLEGSFFSILDETFLKGLKCWVVPENKNIYCEHILKTKDTTSNKLFALERSRNPKSRSRAVKQNTKVKWFVVSYLERWIF